MAFGTIPPPPPPVASLDYLSVLSFSNTLYTNTHWSYTPPLGHLSSHLADPAYWQSISRNFNPGDWIFAVHTTFDGRRYNAIYAITSGPLGLWAQQLLSSVPAISSLNY